LFVDTVNTPARMESTGKPDQVHLSHETVDLLLDAGKSHWVTTLEDKTVAKGKGVLNTYWLQTTVPDLFESIHAGDSTTDSVSTCNGVGEEYVKQNQGADHGTDSKTQGLVEWNVHILKGALVKVAANRRAQEVNATCQHHMLELEHEFLAGAASLDEVKEIVNLPKCSKVSTHQLEVDEIGDKITEQLREYIQQIHDVDHPVVPNAFLVKENAPLTSIYSRSVAELDSLDLAWSLLMDEKYQDLRRSIYTTMTCTKIYADPSIQQKLNSFVFAK
jgi:hypothetical protein